MRVPDHYLHVYDKPTAGNNFQRRYRVYGYKHKIDALGGYTTASCEIDVNPSQAEYFYNTFLGNRVAFYVDNPGEAIWEGIISRITLSNGGIKRTTSTDAMANRLIVSGVRGNSTAARINTTATANTTSQGIYGIKEETLDAPAERQNVSTLYEAIRDAELNDRSWPQNSAIPESSSTLSLSIECVGFSQTLEWELVYTTGADSDAALISPTADITNQISNLLNGTTFFDNTDTSLIASNVVFNTRKWNTTGSTKLERITTLCEAGDSTNRYVFGITLTTNNQRRFYYRQSKSDILYTAYVRDGLQIRNQFGRILPLWSIKPDAKLKINDLSIAFNGIGDDLRETYLSSVSYDQTNQVVTWASEDDISIDGALKFNKPVKPFGLKARSRAHRSSV